MKTSPLPSRSFEQWERDNRVGLNFSVEVAGEKYHFGERLLMDDTPLHWDDVAGVHRCLVLSLAEVSKQALLLDQAEARLSFADIPHSSRAALIFEWCSLRVAMQKARREQMAVEQVFKYAARLFHAQTQKKWGGGIPNPTHSKFKTR